MAKTKEFHIDCGNSNTGTIGFCAVVNATNKKQAIEILAKQLSRNGVAIEYDDKRIEYIEVYFNPDNVKASEVTVNE